jgi:hypothetical protein
MAVYSIEVFVKKSLILLLCIHISLSAGIYSNQSLLQKVQRMVRQTLNSPAAPFILGGMAFSAMPYGMLFKNKAQNAALNIGSEYAGKWFPWPLSSYLNEWVRVKKMEQLQMKLSYMLIGATVAVLLMQSSKESSDQPMIVNKIILNNNDKNQISCEPVSDEL